MSAVNLTTPSQIERARWVVIRAGIKLEKLGMKRRGQSCRQIALKAFGLPPSTSYDDLIERCSEVIKEFEE